MKNTEKTEKSRNNCGLWIQTFINGPTMLFWEKINDIWMMKNKFKNHPYEEMLTAVQFQSPSGGTQKNKIKILIAFSL